MIFWCKKGQLVFGKVSYLYYLCRSANLLRSPYRMLIGVWWLLVVDCWHQKQARALLLSCHLTSSLWRHFCDQCCCFVLANCALGLSAWLTVCLSIYRSVCLSVCLSACMSVCSAVWQCPSVSTQHICLVVWHVILSSSQPTLVLLSVSLSVCTRACSTWIPCLRSFVTASKQHNATWLVLRRRSSKTRYVFSVTQHYNSFSPEFNSISGSSTVLHLARMHAFSSLKCLFLHPPCNLLRSALLANEQLSNWATERIWNSKVLQSYVM